MVEGSDGPPCPGGRYPALLAEYRDKLTREPIPSPAKDPEKAGPARCRSAATVNRYLAVLSHCFTVAVKELGWAEDNPLLKVSRPKEPRGRIRFLSEDEQAPDGSTIAGERTRLLSTSKASARPHLYAASACPVHRRTLTGDPRPSVGKNRLRPPRGRAEILLEQREDMRHRLEEKDRRIAQIRAVPKNFRRYAPKQWQVWAHCGLFAISRRPFLLA